MLMILEMQKCIICRIFRAAEIRNLIRNKRRLRRVWMLNRSPVGKPNFNQVANYPKNRLKELVLKNE